MQFGYDYGGNYDVELFNGSVLCGMNEVQVYSEFCKCTVNDFPFSGFSSCIIIPLFELKKLIVR